MNINPEIAEYALDCLKDIQRDECFSPERPDLKPTPAQLEVMTDTNIGAKFVVGANRSGKSQLGGRIITWLFNNAYPYMDMKELWGEGPYTFMVLGRVGGQIENEIFLKKIKPLLKPGTYKEHRIGGILQWISHRENGNRIIFQSHHNLKEAREKVQAYTLQAIWLDEQAESASFIAELQTRLFTTNGWLICTFTPLVRSDEVRKMVDGAEPPYGKKYQLKMFDNPIFQEDPEKIKKVLAQYAHYSEAERNTRLYGDWYVGNKSVYEFDPDKMKHTHPDYSYGWRHVLAVDPAMSGKTGSIVLAEDPTNGIWYVVHDDYFEGVLNPRELVLKIQKKYEHLNIVRRVYDPHETWFYNTALSEGIKYWSVYKKNDRKHELIKNLQTKLSSGMLKFFEHCRRISDEITNCQWSTTTDNRIIGASKYHLLDALQYGVDILPKYEGKKAEVNAKSAFDNWLRCANVVRKRNEQRKRMKISKRRRRTSWIK